MKKQICLLIAIAIAAATTLTLYADKHKEGEAKADAKHEHKHEAPEGGFPKTASPEGARAYIITPKDGKTVGKTFVVRFGLKGMGVAPAGIDLPNTGHHHLLVDAKGKPAPGMPLPADENHLHYGGGQTEVELTLEPGTHTLQLALGDLNHVPHDPPVMSKKITITVEDK